MTTNNNINGNTLEELASSFRNSDFMRSLNNVTQEIYNTYFPKKSNGIEPVRFKNNKMPVDLSPEKEVIPWILR